MKEFICILYEVDGVAYSMLLSHLKINIFPSITPTPPFPPNSPHLPPSFPTLILTYPQITVLSLYNFTEPRLILPII